MPFKVDPILDSPLANSDALSSARWLGMMMLVLSEINIVNGYPFLSNDEDLTDKSFSLAKIFLGEENVSELPIRMTAEDFAFISQKVPSCFFRLGTAGKNNTFTSGVHSPTFNVEESAIETGMGLLAWLAVNA